MNPRRLTPWLGGAILLWAFTAPAQEQRIPGFELERLQLNPSGRGSLVLSTGDLLPQGQYRVSLTGHWEHKPLVLFEGAEEREVIISERATVHLSGAYAFLDWLELGAQVPVMAQWAHAVPRLGLAEPESTAVGTPWLLARAGLLSEQEGGALDLALHLGVPLPLGSQGALTRDEGLLLSPRVGLGKHLGGSCRAGAELGVLIRTKRYALSPEALGPQDEPGVEVNGGFNFTATSPGLKQELLVRWTLPLASAPSSLEALFGLRFPVGSVELYALGGPGLGRTPGTPMFRVLAGVALASEVKP